MTTVPTNNLAARLQVTAVLASRLRAWARGSHGTEAAVELLIAHGSWLCRRDFVGRCVETFVGDDDYGTVWMAAIDFAAIPSFLADVGCSGSEASMLRLAAELAFTDSGTSVAWLLSSLDRANVGLVLDAVAHSAGWHEQRCTHTVTGNFGGVE